MQLSLWFKSDMWMTPKYLSFDSFLRFAGLQYLIVVFHLGRDRRDKLASILCWNQGGRGGVALHLHVEDKIILSFRFERLVRGLTFFWLTSDIVLLRIAVLNNLIVESVIPTPYFRGGLHSITMERVLPEVARTGIEKMIEYAYSFEPYFAPTVVLGES